LFRIKKIKKVIGKNIAKTLKLNETAQNREKKIKSLLEILSVNLRKKYKAITKKDKNKTSLYKKLSPNILGEVTNNNIPVKLKKKFLNLLSSILKKKYELIKNKTKLINCFT
tara:strand:- start:71 stop:406 length:336 start_codon:yes stop_codon:yes gene_type:complete